MSGRVNGGGEVLSVLMKGFNAPPESEFEAKVRGAGRWAESDPEARPLYDDSRGLIASAAESVMRLHRFARGPGRELYVYRDGCYRPDGEILVQTLVRDVLDQWGKLTRWRKAVADECVAYILASHTPALDERPPLNVVNVRNGLLDIASMTLRPHTPEHLSPIQLPVDFDPEAMCPHWERFIRETLPEDSHRVVWELVAWLITPDMCHQKAVLLSGPGGNGKSVLLDAVTALLGRENIAARSLHDLEGDRFATADLVGKLANICADLPSQHLESSMVFKAVVSGDRMSAQRKHRPAFDFSPYSRLVFSANALPRSADSSDGFFRRWLVVPFTRSFEGAERRNKRELDNELQCSAELSGVLNRALAVLPHLRRAGFTETPTLAAAAEEFRATTDPLAAWLDRNTVRDGEGRIPCKDLLFRFNDEVSKANGSSYMTAHAMTKALKARGIEKKLSHDYGYVGIRWAD